MPSSQRPRGRGASAGIDGRVGLSVESSVRRRRGVGQPRWPWPVVTVLGCLLAVAAVWVVLTALLAPEWLAAKGSRFSDLTAGATRLWLLAHGVPMTSLGLDVSIVPLGLSLVVLAVGEETCRYGTRVMSAARRAAELPIGWREAARVAAVHASTHLVLVVLLCGSTGSSAWLRAVAGGLVLGVAAGAIGAVRGARVDVGALVPAEARAIARASVGGAAVVLAGAAVLLAVSLLANGQNVISLHRSLDPGAWGSVALVLMELAWLPDLVVWAASWTLGSGFSLGAGSVVSPFGVQLGIVPSIPVLGALPGAGVPAVGLRAWIALPVLAGAASAWIALNRLRRGVARDTLVGVGAGVGSGLLLALLGAAAAGGIGTGRLIAMGAVMPDSGGLALALVGGGGLVAGLGFGVVRHVLAAGAAGEEPFPTPEAGPGAGLESNPASGSHAVARMRDWGDEAQEDTRHTPR